MPLVVQVGWRDDAVQILVRREGDGPALEPPRLLERGPPAQLAGAAPLDLGRVLGHRRPLLPPGMRLAERHGGRTQDASRAGQHGAAADPGYLLGH